MLKCITFDCTNTLIKVNNGVTYQYGRILNDHFNYKLDEKLTNKNFKKYFLEQNMQQPGYGYKIGIKSRDWWGSIIQRLLTENSLHTNQKQFSDNELSKISHFIYEEFCKEKCWIKYQGCDSLLNDLKSNGYKLGVISNFDERLFKILAELKIFDYFDFICIPSNLEGYAKPSKEVFAKAFNLSGIKSCSFMMHVGDDYELDFKAATNLGFRSILVNHENKNKPYYNSENSVKNLYDLRNSIIRNF